MQVNPKGQGEGSNRVGRGGSWGNNSWYCSAMYRNSGSPMIAYFYQGFRVVLFPVVKVKVKSNASKS